MWKCVSRSVKTFKKTVLKRNTILSTNALQHEELHCILKFIPAVLNRCHCFSNAHQGSCESFTKNKDKEGPKEKKTSFLGGLEDYFVDALKWSGLIVFVGYYGVYYKRKRIFSISDPYLKECSPRITGYYKALEYLIDSLGIKPYNYVFPDVKAGKSVQGKQQLVVDSTTEENQEKNFSTLEEAHQKVLGTLCNWLGVQCMHSGQQKEALHYFLQSAEEEHAPGIFNLGLCHEKGYGTSQNFTRAAEYYQRASDLGHANAMYNLGVFYAQGKGEISPDLDHARKLFEAAARLGQVDAIRALNLEKQTTEELPDSVLHNKCKGNKGNIFPLDELIFDRLLGKSSPQSDRHIGVCDNKVKANCESFSYAERKKLNSSGESDSGVLDLSPHIEPYVFLV